jgi:holo-[acyl-carrier protein] synthase
MILGVGNDILDVARVRRQIRSDGPDIREQIFTPGEIRYCEGKRYPARHYAARFAAKEAFFKALGTGQRDDLSWRDVEVRSDPAGKPEIVLSGEALRTAERRGVVQALLSLSHTASLAMASVILEGDPVSHPAPPAGSAPGGDTV